MAMSLRFQLTINCLFIISDLLFPSVCGHEPLSYNTLHTVLSLSEILFSFLKLKINTLKLKTSYTQGSQAKSEATLIEPSQKKSS